ncbi:Plug domain-containing protein [Pontixanthobacter gangjinensis]
MLSSMILAAQKEQDLQEFQNQFVSLTSEKQESLYLHLSKTKFLPGEDLWFSSYLFNHATLTPINRDEKIHVQLVNKAGNVLESKTYLSSQGHTEGMLQLSDKKYRSGNYLLIAYTDSRENHFSQPIEILGSARDKGAAQELKYDLQLLPEGGHLISGILNTVGVKLINASGHGIDFQKGYLMNSTGDTLTSFASNRFGMAKFLIRPEKGNKYKVVIPADPEFYTAALPEIEETGIVLSSSYLKDQIILTTKTNQVTNQRIQDQDFYLGIEEAGELKLFEFHFPEEQLNVNIPVMKDSLSRGTHLATLFDAELNPISERIVFNGTETGGEIKLQITENTGDSLKVNISSQENSLSLLSISVLPKATKAYGNQKGIHYSAFIKPFVNGFVENPGYYFDPKINERERLYNLDLLFLTQGWSKYDWNQVLENQTPSTPQIGYSIEGRIQSDFDASNKLLLKSRDSGLFEVLEIEKNGDFEMDSLFVLKDSEISIGLLNKRNQVSKPVMFAKVLPRENSLAIEISEEEWEDTEAEFLAREAGDFRNFTRNSTQLDTLTINVKKKEKEEIDLDPFMRSSPMNSLRMVDDEMRSQFVFILDYIRFKGFTIISSPNGVLVCKRATGLKGCTPARIYLDGMELREDAGMLSNLMTENISAISINNSGIGLLQPSQGNGGGGVIRIQTRKDYEQADNNYNEETTYKLKAKNGFSISKEYYNSKYGSYTSKLFQNYGIIDWKSLIYLDNEEKLQNFKILNTATDKISFFVEGITGNGKLISQRIDIDL